MRILLNPDPAEGGAPTQQQGQGQQQQAEAVQLSPSEYQSLLSRAAEADRLQSERAAASRSESDRLRDLEARFHAAETRNVLHDALGGLEFVSDAARQDALSLMASELRVNPDGQVVHRATARPAREWLAEQARGSRLAHYLRASTQGGTGSRPSQGGMPAPSEPGGDSLGHQMISAMQARGQAAGPIGLRGARRRG